MEKTLNHLLTDESFIKLDALLRKHNVFRALSIENSEIRHSKFLAYLLNPNEDHGLGAEFLLNFILWLSNKTEESIEVTNLDIDFAEVIPEFTEAKKTATSRVKNEEEEEVISTKKDRLDILLKIPYKDKKDEQLVVAVEMKISAKVGKNQLQKYDGLVKGFKPKPSPLIKVLLTIDGNVPDDADRWFGVKQLDLVVKTIETTLLKREGIDGPIVQMIKDYRDTVLKFSRMELSSGSDHERYCENLKDYRPVLKLQEEYLLRRHKAAYLVLDKYIRDCDDVQGRGLAYFSSTMSQKKYLKAYSNRVYYRFYPSTLTDFPFKTDVGGIELVGNSGVGLPLVYEVLVYSEGENNYKARMLLVMFSIQDPTIFEAIISETRDVINQFPGWTYTKNSSDPAEHFTKRLMRTKTWKHFKNEEELKHITDDFIKQAEKISSKLLEKYRENEFLLKNLLKTSFGDNSDHATSKLDAFQ